MVLAPSTRYLLARLLFGSGVSSASFDPVLARPAALAGAGLSKDDRAKGVRYAPTQLKIVFSPKCDLMSFGPQVSFVPEKIETDFVLHPPSALACQPFSSLEQMTR